VIRAVALSGIALALVACGTQAPSGASPDSSSPQSADASLPASAGPSLGPLPFADYSGWVAYQTCEASCSSELDEGIRLVRGDGSNDHAPIEGMAGREAHPDFSFDGARLAFDNLASFEDPDVTYVADADGSNPTLAAACDAPSCLQLWEPAWSPDGMHIAVALASGELTPTGPERFGIAIIDLAAGTFTPVVEHPAAEGQDHFPRWSPAGDRLVFWRGRYGDAGAETAIFVVGTGGGEPVQLTDWTENAGDPDWSPDGSLIVFATDPLLEFQTSGTSELFTIQPDGSDRRQLTAYGTGGPRAAQPRWTPDGLAVVYTRTTQQGYPRTLWIINADGSNDRSLLAEDTGIFTHPEVQPIPSAAP
jgi:Tol biopolymer transport system component